MRKLILYASAFALLCGQAGAEKSPKTAFFLSLLVPGLGEWYAGAKWRGVGFMSAEALTWTAYISWRGKGNDIKAEFRAYADRHWQEARYRLWRDFNRRQDDPYHETHALPSKENDTQQYYELIGKYHQFVYGWDDAPAPRDFTTDNAGVQSARRQAYETRRNDSNKYLKRASLVTGLAVLNHIASAIHASAYTRTLQKRTEPRLCIDIAPVDTQGRTMVALKTRF